MPSFAESDSTASPERRSYGRRRIDDVTYVDLGADNGAILLDLSEGGTGFQSVAPLDLGKTVILKFKATRKKDYLESRAEVAWVDESGKRGGLRFVELSADARAQIRAWADDQSATEAAPEIHRAEASFPALDSLESLPASLVFPWVWNRCGPKSTPHADTQPEAPANVASARKALPVPSEIHDTAPPVETPHWVWREPYLAALREQNPFSLRERLLTAERAILSRIEALHGAPDDLPEPQALREALNSLYARAPKKTFGPPSIVEDQEEYDWERQNRTKLGAVVALAALFAFAAGWVLASKSSVNNALQSRGEASERQGNATSLDSVFASLPDISVIDEPPPGSSPLQDNRAITPVPGEPNDPRIGGTMHAQRKAKSTRRLVSIPPKPASEIRAEPQSIRSPSMEDQAKTTETQRIEPAAQQPISQGSVTVSFSTYPSLRIPPELRSKVVGTKLQIGQVVSRIDPIYPEDAERQRIEGTVNLRAIIGTDGSVKGLEGMSGPPLLVPAAASAVRQWHYQPTLLSDQPIETAQDVTIVFRLSRNAASTN